MPKVKFRTATGEVISFSTGKRTRKNPKKKTARSIMEEALRWAKGRGLKTSGGNTQIRPPAGVKQDSNWAYLPYLPAKTAAAIKARFGSAVVVRKMSSKNPLKYKRGKLAGGSVKHRSGGATVALRDPKTGRYKKVTFKRTERTAAAKSKRKALARKLYKQNGLADYQFTSSTAKKAAKKRKGAKKTAATITIPKGKKKGDTFRKGNNTYVVVSFVNANGKRVRYARKV